MMTAWSCADHLGAAALVLSDKHGMPSLYTLTAAPPRPQQPRATSPPRTSALSSGYGAT